MPSLVELEEAAVAIGHDLPLEEMAEGRKSLRGVGPSLWAANVRYYELLRAERARDAATGNVEAVAEMADEAIETIGWNIPKNSKQYEQLCEEITKANLAALSVATAQRR